MDRRRAFWATAALAIAMGCDSAPPRAPAIGEAYAGPASLPLRQEIQPRAPVAATVPHGERLEVIGRRRRFVKLRTASGVEGWTHEGLLLSGDQVKALRELALRAKSAPSQGEATTFDPLNVHTEPDRQSPSFFQMKEGDKVDVLARQVAPRHSNRRPFLPPAAPPAAKKRAKKPKREPAVPPPPKPAAPALPVDWIELSTLVEFEEPEPEDPPPAPPAPPPRDDWSLVRNASGQAGWVLTRRLFMNIPDEVAQYAEGRRIVSYFRLGEVRDKDQIKPTWLWTTVERGLEPHDFDSIRVFAWSTRRHRYETAYIERNLKGFLPVVLAPPGFTIVVEKKDGLRYRRTYSVADIRVRLAQESLVEPEPAAKPDLIAAEKAPETAPVEPSFAERIRGLFRR